MSFLSLFRKNTDEVSLLLDIGNGSITGSLVLFRKGSKPDFLYSLEVPFIISEKPNVSKLAEDMVGLLQTLLQDTMKLGFRHKYWKDKTKKIDGALLTFSSPWFVSKTKHIELSNDSSFVITKAFVEDIIKKEEEIFKNELKSNVTESDFQVIEKSIVHTKINGYTLDDSIGKKTKNLDAFLYMSVVSTGIINKVEDILLKFAHIPKNRVLIHTFPLVSFTVVRDVFSASSDFILIDVTGEVTDITLVQNDVIKQSVSIPSGRNFMIRKIMKSFNVPSEIAESTLNLYTEDKLSPEDLVKMEEVIVDVEKEWSIYLESGLNELSPKMILPGNIYLTADNDVSGVYINFLRLSKTDSTAMFRKALNINHVSLESTSTFYIADSTVRTNEFAVILAIFYNKVYSTLV